MPELPILGTDGKLAPVAPMLTLAVMVYPDDQAAREEYASSCLVGLLEHKEGSDLSSLEFLVPVLRRAPTPNEVAMLARRATQNSWVATTTLSIMLSATEHHPQEKVNAKRAFWIIRELKADSPTGRTLQEAWKRFRTVAHLDLGVSALMNAHGVSVSVSRDTAFFDALAFISNHFEEYLTYAESIRRSVERHRLVASRELWRVPSALKLPKILAPPFPPMTKAMLDALASYSPEHPGRRRLAE